MRIGLAAWLTWPMVALGGAHETDWMRDWPLVLEASDAAYRLALPPAVYRTTQAHDLADLQVVDASGTAMPTRVTPVPTAPAKPGPAQQVPWFPLPVPEATEARWELIGETDAQGRLHRVETRGLETPFTERRDGAALVDLSGLEAPVMALELAWDATSLPVDSSYRVEASDDLEEWRTVLSRGRLLEMAHEGQRIVRRRLPLAQLSADYLRLRPLPGNAPVALTGVRVITAAMPRGAPPQWRLLEGQRQAEDGVHYRLEGRFPVELADVVPAGTGTASWRLWSREGDDDAWRLRAGPWTGYRLHDAAGELHSPPQPLTAPVRDRHWRLTTETTQEGEPPRLRLGYRPERLVFLADGEPPYRLAAGSARVRREERPVEPVLVSLRQRHGEDWQPASASLGAPRTLAGEEALQPRRDWTTWLLWSVLVGGAILVAGMALKLMRQPV